MASSNSSVQNSGSGSEGDDLLPQHILDQRQRKRKRMLSNRESARRSRMKKQQHLDDLIGQVGQLKKENNQISTSIGINTQLYLNLEAENAILRAQMAELSNRLQSLNEIIQYINSSSNCISYDDVVAEDISFFNDYCGGGFNDPWNSPFVNNQPIMASNDTFMY